MTPSWFAALPNCITVARIFMTPAVILFIRNGLWGPALSVFVVAGLSDALDGWLAKTFRLESALGAILDPIADKALIISIFVTLATLGLAPEWLAILIVGRDVTIMLFVGVAWMSSRPLAIRPHLASKATTAAQLTFAGLILARAAFGFDFPIFYQVLANLTAALTVASGCVYLWLWSRHMRPQHVASGSAAVTRRAR